MNAPRTPASIADAAKLTDIGERTIRRWITARLLATYRTPGGSRVVIVQDVIALERTMRNRSKARPRDVRRRVQLDKVANRAESLALNPVPAQELPDPSGPEAVSETPG